MAKRATKVAVAKVQEEVRIEYVRLPDVKPAKRNPKLHDVPTIVASIRRWGFKAPPVEDAATGRIVAGHGRKEAVEFIKSDTPGEVPRGVKVGEDGEWMIPVVRGGTFENEAEAEQYLLADNRLVELAGWDEKVLGSMLQAVADHGGDALAAIGWSADQVASIAAGWDSDITAIRSHGENTDGILAKIVVFCPQAVKEKVSKVVAAAVKRFPKVKIV